MTWDHREDSRKGSVFLLSHKWLSAERNNTLSRTAAIATGGFDWIEVREYKLFFTADCNTPSWQLAITCAVRSPLLPLYFIRCWIIKAVSTEMKYLYTFENNSKIIWCPSYHKEMINKRSYPQARKNYALRASLCIFPIMLPRRLSPVAVTWNSLVTAGGWCL